MTMTSNTGSRNGEGDKADPAVFGAAED